MNPIMFLWLIPLSYAVYRAVRVWIADSIAEQVRVALLGHWETDPDDGEDYLVRPGWLMTASGDNKVLLVAAAFVMAAAIIATGVGLGEAANGGTGTWAATVGVAAFIVACYAALVATDEGRGWVQELLSCQWCIGVHAAFWALLGVSAVGLIPFRWTWADIATFAIAWMVVAAAASWAFLIEDLLVSAAKRLSAPPKG